MKKEGMAKELLIISVATTIALTAWLVLDIYRILEKEEIPEIIQKQIEPLDPKLDTKVLEGLEGKQSFDFLGEIAIDLPATAEAATQSAESEEE